MSISDTVGRESRTAEYPAPELTPLQVVLGQTAALQAGDNQRAFRWVSPRHKQEIGIARRGFKSWYRPPDFAALSGYSLVHRCMDHIITGALHISDTQFLCTVRIWPSTRIGEHAPVTSPPLDVLFCLEKQPRVRPACYDYDPLQMGISAGPPGDGCWMVDYVSLANDDDGGSDDDGSDGSNPDGGSGGAVHVPNTVLARCV